LSANEVQKIAEGRVSQVKASANQDQDLLLQSFSDAQRDTEGQIVSVTVADRKNPLQVKLETVTDEETGKISIVIHSFSQDADGNQGIVESSGKVKVGDLLVAVNDQSTEGWTLQELKQGLDDATYPAEIFFQKPSAS